MLLSVRLQTKWLWFKSRCSYLRKSDISNFEKKADFHDKLKNINKNVISKKTKHVLAENESEKLQTFNSQVFLLVEIALLYFKNNR